MQTRPGAKTPHLPVLLRLLPVAQLCCFTGSPMWQRSSFLTACLWPLTVTYIHRYSPNVGASIAQNGNLVTLLVNILDGSSFRGSCLLTGFALNIAICASVHLIANWIDSDLVPLNFQEYNHVSGSWGRYNSAGLHPCKVNAVNRRFKHDLRPLKQHLI